MVLFLSISILFCIVFLATPLCLGYVKAVNKVGHEVARRNIRHRIPALVLIALNPIIPFLGAVSSFLGAYIWVSLFIYWCLLFYFCK